MYLDEYKRWMAAELEDADLKPELAKIEGNDDEIKDRFAVALKFGTAGLRGVLGAGTNRMNIYVVRQATQGLANWVKTQGGSQTVAISYDSRLKSDIFAKTAAGVLAANGIKVRIYDALMPVPALSFATRYYQCNAGIMVTASHNPAKYNGYKAYGPDGCQMTDDAAAIVYDEIQKTDVLTGAKYISFAEGVEQGLIRFVGDDCKKALYDAIEARQVRPGLCKTAGLKLVYSPLNGSGLVPVTHVLNDMGITDITIVPEQEYPNGYFTTCSYPNPEIFEALKLGLELATKTGADLMLATDPDADRVGIAMKCPDGSYELVSGNEMGAVVVSGMAKGIDGAAMRGALQAGGFTAAVLGGGVDVVYPAENRRLYEDIAATGVLLSEYPPGTEPLPGHFPVRNRIISGLSLAALVVEAPVRSGALITAHAALDQGRDVFAVPGPIDAAASVGCNRLIRDGAGLAASGWDILSVYHSRFPHRLHPAHVTVPEPGDAPKPEEDKSSPLPETPPEPAQKPQLPVLDLDRNREGLTDDQLALIRVLDTETPLLTDEAAEQTGLPVRRVLSALTVLEIDGYAQRSGPRSYVRTVRLHSEKEGS